MKKSDFDFEQFYYDNGQELVSVGLIMEDPHYQYWEIHYDATTDQVTLRSPSGEMREPDRDFLHSCTKPDPVRVPAFPK